MDWGGSIRRLRSARGWKQAALAETLGVDQGTVSRWERGLQIPEITMRHKLRDMCQHELPERDRMALLAVSLSPNPAVAVDRGLVVLAVSPSAAAIHGLSPGEMHGTTLRPLLSHDLLAAFEAMEQAEFWAGSVAAVHAVADHRGTDGYRRYLWTPLFLSGGEVIAVGQCAAIGRDEFLSARRTGPFSVVAAEVFVTARADAFS